MRATGAWHLSVGRDAADRGTAMSSKVGWRWLLLPLVLVGLSCSGMSTSVETNKSGSTTTPLGQGSDCTPYTYWLYMGYGVRLLDTAGDSVSQVMKQMSLLFEVRVFLRSLDLGVVDQEKRTLLSAMQDYHDALNRYVESDRTDLSVNSVRFAYADAHVDFRDALKRECGS